MEGRVQQTIAAITPPSMARVDWHIVRAVSEIYGHALPYDDLVGIRKRMADIAPSMANYNKNDLPTCISTPFILSKIEEKVSSLKISSAKLTPLLKDLSEYYQTDIISRASSTMAKCVQSVNKELSKRESFQKRSAKSA